MTRRSRGLATACGIAVALMAAQPSQARSIQETPPVEPCPNQTPLVIARQGSFFAGGEIVRTPSGGEFHGDATYVKYQVPADARDLPMVMWHGGGQFSKTWETTPDGREGYQQIFARRGFAVYLIDQARRASAGRSTDGATILSAADFPPESGTFENFRLGTWAPPGAPHYFPDVQFARDKTSLDQLFWQGAPNTGAEPQDAAGLEMQAGNVIALFEKIGPGILVTHSRGGAYGWFTGMRRPDLVKAIVSYEPVVFAFPTDALPPEMPTQSKPAAEGAQFKAVTPAEFQNLTKFPIQIVYGDYLNLAGGPTHFPTELWRIVPARAQQFVDLVNQRGGKAELVMLPSLGLKGNTHFPFADLNNLQVADLLSAYLHEQGLDTRGGKGGASACR